MNPFKSLLVLSVFASSLIAGTERKTVTYEIDDTTFESTIIYAPNSTELLPGILMVPNWLGPTEASMKKAETIAENGYVIMVVDMYGTSVRPQNGGEAGKAAGFVRGDRQLMRQRANTALEHFLAESKNVGLSSKDMAAIGFCFGGGTVLELGRSGADLDAIVSFHGDLVSPTLEDDAKNNKARILVLHGADDPYVPQSDVSQFTAAMLETDADWQLVQYSNTVHSFTDPAAKSDGAHFNPQSSERAFKAMNALLAETWGQ